MTEVRCPKCRKTLGNEVVGYYRTTCPRCGYEVVLVSTGQATVTDRDGRPVEVRAVVTPR